MSASSVSSTYSSPATSPIQSPRDTQLLDLDDIHPELIPFALPFSPRHLAEEINPGLHIIGICSNAECGVRSDSIRIEVLDNMNLELSTIQDLARCSMCSQSFNSYRLHLSGCRFRAQSIGPSLAWRAIPLGRTVQLPFRLVADGIELSPRDPSEK